MKKETVLLLALVLGVGGYKYWQSQQQKKALKEAEPSQSIYEILKSIEKEAKDAYEAIKKVAEVFKIEEADANRTYELYLQNKNITPQAFDEVLKKNGLME